MVKSRWNDAEAAKLDGDPLALRVYSSRLMSVPLPDSSSFSRMRARRIRHGDSGGSFHVPPVSDDYESSQAGKQLWHGFLRTCLPVVGTVASGLLRRFQIAMAVAASRRKVACALTAGHA